MVQPPRGAYFSMEIGLLHLARNFPEKLPVLLRDGPELALRPAYRKGFKGPTSCSSEACNSCEPLVITRERRTR